MAPTRVAVTGATGTMGGLVIEAAEARADVTVAAAIHRGGGGRVHGIAVDPADDLDAVLREREVDALVDFTGASSSVEYVTAARAAGVAAVVGTTGFDDGEIARLREAAGDIPVLKAAPFNRGVPAMLDAVESLVAGLSGWDVEVTGTHHSRKLDAPSGTTKAILRRIADAGGPGEQVHGREGEHRRDPDEVGVHDRSAGTIRGEHEVVLAGNGQVLALTHRIEDRRVYAENALDAAVWIARQGPGWYELTDVPESDPSTG